MSKFARYLRRAEDIQGTASDECAGDGEPRSPGDLGTDASPPATAVALSPARSLSYEAVPSRRYVWQTIHAVRRSIHVRDLPDHIRTDQHLHDTFEELIGGLGPLPIPLIS